MMAAAITLTVTLVLVVYAVTTKTDITLYHSSFYILAAGLFSFRVFVTFTKNNVIHVGITVATVILYAFYLVYDL